jgi:hypothetical protein
MSIILRGAGVVHSLTAEYPTTFPRALGILRLGGLALFVATVERSSQCGRTD